MSNYRTHTKINLFFTFPVLLFIGALLTLPEAKYVWTFAISFLYATFFMTPDLDLANSIRLLSLRGLFSVPFRSYAFIFRHRGMSHSLLLGTLTRLCWLFLHAIGFLYLFYNIKPTNIDFIPYCQSFQTYFLYSLAGVFLADASHILVDRFA